MLQRSGLSAIGDILRHRRLSLFAVARLDPGVPAHGVLRLMVKAERQWPAGEDHRAALATSGSTRFRRMPMPYRYLHCGHLRSPVGHRAAQRSIRTMRRRRHLFKSYI